MRLRTLTAATAVLLAVTTIAEAQGGGGGQMRWGVSKGGGAMRTMAPLSSDSLAAIVGLDGAQRQQYATLHDQFMQETKSERDSLRTMTDLMRNSRRSGNEDAAKQQLGTVRQLREALMQRRKTFDTAVKNLLTDPQKQKYDQWHEEAQKKMTAERGRGGRRP